LRGEGVNVPTSPSSTFSVSPPPSNRNPSPVASALPPFMQVSESKLLSRHTLNDEIIVPLPTIAPTSHPPPPPPPSPPLIHPSPRLSPSLTQTIPPNVLCPKLSRPCLAPMQPPFLVGCKRYADPYDQPYHGDGDKEGKESLPPPHSSTAARRPCRRGSFHGIRCRVLLLRSSCTKALHQKLLCRCVVLRVCV